MLVGQLHVAVALEQHAEQVVGRDRALQHDAVDQEHGDLRLGIAHAREEHVLQQALLLARILARELPRVHRLSRHDGGDRVLVDKLRLAVATEQDREVVEPGHDALQLDALDQKHGHRGFVLAQDVQKRILKVGRTARLAIVMRFRFLLRILGGLRLGTRG